VTGGLVYTALQFRGWRATQYVANFTKLVALQLQLRKMVVDDPALATLAGVAPGTTPDEIRGNYYNLMQVSLFEIAWFSHRHDQLTRDYCASWEANMAPITQRPAFRTMWKRIRPRFCMTASASI
jgi:hypothetical protein